MSAMRVWTWFLILLAAVGLGVRLACQCWDKVILDSACLVVFMVYLRTMPKTHRK